MEIRKRKELRQNLLLEIYNGYFDNEGPKDWVKQIANSQKENYLAYRYLTDKGYIKATFSAFKDPANPCKVTIENITVDGIDAIENNLI